MTLVLSRSGSLSSLSSLSTIATPTTTRTSPPPPHSSLPPGCTSSASAPASNHTPRPLQEEKTEPYYADDSYKDPPPPAHVLTSEFGVKIRDFALSCRRGRKGDEKERRGLRGFEPLYLHRSQRHLLVVSFFFVCHLSLCIMAMLYMGFLGMTRGCFFSCNWDWTIYIYMCVYVNSTIPLLLFL
ncbi:uncharacterized protein C8R40DRAFT_87819 [Lentinula edodes]|uniref:uncharacterized protein n=1 Tax=Lentinula edodes TaxID=5353 RepID=UPI001E8CA078|nr:uncharacterized protein C8R40DRAFT_87819 [Lentinula edodes]KAH7877018.1 hypothetical protein C8R40DRAFT_87819 [Lentinula edodes]